MSILKNCYKIIGRAFFFLAILLFSCSLYAQETQETQKTRDITEDEQGAYYTVKKGDTLWDISKKFLNSPWYWPELWEVNSSLPIPNPHLIYPGQRIRLFRRDMAGGLPKSPGQISESLPQSQASLQPLPDTEFESPGTDVPLGGVSSLEDDIKGKYYNYSLINQASFLLQEPYPAKGAIFKVQDNKEMISDGDLVFLRAMNNHTFLKNQKYTVYRMSNLIKNEETGIITGYQHRMLGVIEITRIEPEFLMAVVTSTYHPFQIGDLLMPFENRSPKVVLSESVKGMMGTIIGSEDNETMLGEHSVGFIDKGQLDGILPGQQYKVFFQETAKPDPAGNQSILLPPADVATLLVLFTTPVSSTFLITYSSRSINIGAKFHGPM
ncbi:Lytic transglycosylase LysM domain-containing protein [Desulfonema limicola]|uniref:Lytic transglycosylase LysM domain-containing protein n=1 Tax=Desulfonema limicola TaxID=45656 RepID=A0A975BCZ6_9BACT|nr:LysM domain-containing protein [Desulfonema limicola]QTA83197.1 Lytic transglycosylase LysM domain-containing protein [Desulfonema limicola]